MSVACNIDGEIVPAKKRYSLFEIQHLELYKMYIQQQAAFWTPAEIKMTTDLHDYRERLTGAERSFIEHILAYFNVGDVAVCDLLSKRFSNLGILEAELFYNAQKYIEGVHMVMYSTFIEALISDPQDRAMLFDAVENFTNVKEKIQWTEKYGGEDSPMGEAVVALAITEGIFFTASFAVMFWLKDRNLMHGLTLANELISRDENLHCEFACYIFSNYLKHKPTDERVEEMIKSAVDIEYGFYRRALPDDQRLETFNRESMLQYIRYVADRLSQKLIGKRIYGDENPFPFVEKSSMIGKTNMFERGLSEYSQLV